MSDKFVTLSKIYHDKMLNVVKRCIIINNRGFKNFGHKRQPVSSFTVLWHGFLTFAFIGMGIEWKRIAKFLVGENADVNITGPLD